MANRTVRNSAKARLLAVLDRPDGEGKAVMTIDLWGPGRSGPRLGLAAVPGILSPAVGC